MHCAFLQSSDSLLYSDNNESGPKKSIYKLNDYVICIDEIIISSIAKIYAQEKTLYLII